MPGPLDHELAESGYELVGDADDLVILCRIASEARQALERVQSWTANAGLTLHPDKTRMVDASRAGFDFLGYHFEGGRRWPRDKSLMEFKVAICAKTPRKHGQSLRVIIAWLSRMRRIRWGWFEYLKHTSYTNVFRSRTRRYAYNTIVASHNAGHVKTPRPGASSQSNRKRSEVQARNRCGLRPCPLDN